MNLLRSDLYRLVWALPSVRVAPLLGVSSSALTKICRRFAIPAPERGYWRRVQVGQAVKEPAPLSGPDVALRFVVAEELEQALRDLPAITSTPPEALADPPVAGPLPELESRAEQTTSTEAARFHDRQSVALRTHPAPVRVEVLEGPTLDDLKDLSQQHRLAQDIASLILEVDNQVSRQPAPVAAVLALWSVRAKETVRAVSPVDRIVEACRNASWRDLPR